MQHLSHFVEAAEGEQHQDGFGLLVDLRGAQVFRPALQHVGALCRAQAHLEDHPRGAEKTKPRRVSTSETDRNCGLKSNE